MPDGTDLEGMLGEVLSQFELPVDASKAAEMAAAVHASPDVAGAVPTFTVTSGFHQDRRALMTGPLGLDISRTLHGEQRYRFTRPVVVGDRLRGTTRLADVRQREGSRGGTMRLVTLSTDYVDGDGEEVLREQMVLVEVAGATSGAEGGGDAGATPRAAPVEPASGKRLDAPRVLPPVSRTDIVRYAGASGDFTRIHHDEPYAQSLGLQGVFAMGMLAGGILAAWVDHVVGARRLAEVGLRFKERVWPGDVLTCHAWRPDPDDADDVQATLRNGDGASVVTLRARTAG